jgi:hypothetical protein
MDIPSYNNFIVNNSLRGLRMNKLMKDTLLYNLENQLDGSSYYDFYISPLEKIKANNELRAKVRTNIWWF